MLDPQVKKRACQLKGTLFIYRKFEIFISPKGKERYAHSSGGSITFKELKMT